VNLALILAVARDLKTGFVKRFLTLCLVASTITFAQGLGVSTPNYLTFTNYGSDVVVMGRIFNDRSPVLSSHPILAPDAQIWPAPKEIKKDERRQKRKKKKRENLKKKTRIMKERN
jgi:hypothetical protein